jgi:RNA polymerase-binding protein DksA
MTPALDDRQIQELRQQLDAREAVLQAEVRAWKEEHGDRPSAIAPQVDDQGAAGEERFRNGLEHAELERDQEELREIAEARDRIGDGTYGQCVDCGKDIPLPRLKAQPIAKRCVGCQEKYEVSHQTTPRYVV